MLVAFMVLFNCELMEILVFFGNIQMFLSDKKPRDLASMQLLHQLSYWHIHSGFIECVEIK